MAGFCWAIDDCITGWEGFKVVLRRGEAWHADDPFVKANKHLFADEPTVVMGSPVKSSRAVESASAVPGEKRTTRRGPAKK